MKSSHSTTSKYAEQILRKVSHWPARLHELHQRLRPHFARPEAFEHALLYLQAILSDIPRKNGWQIAEQARQARPYGMQRLLSSAVWDEDGVRDDLRTLVCQTLCPPPVFSEQQRARAQYCELKAKRGRGRTRKFQVWHTVRKKQKEGTF